MPKQVLIVDDEETLTWSLAKSLAHDRETYDVITVNDGETALSIFDEQAFDVVVLDIRLPGISGLDVLVKIKEKKPATKVPCRMSPTGLYSIAPMLPRRRLRATSRAGVRCRCSASDRAATGRLPWASPGVSTGIYSSSAAQHGSLIPRS